MPEVTVKMIYAGHVSHAAHTVILGPGDARHQLGEVAHTAGILDKPIPTSRSKQYVLDYLLLCI